MAIAVDPWLLGALAAGGTLVAMWGQVRRLLGSVGRVFVGSARIDESPAAVAVRTYCWRHFRRSSIREQFFSSVESYVQPLEQWANVGFEKIGETSMVLWRGLVPIWLKYEAGQNSSGGVQIRFIRGTLDMDELVIASLREHRESEATFLGKRFRVNHVTGKRSGGQEGDRKVKPLPVGLVTAARFLEWKQTDLGARSELGSALDALALEPMAMEAVTEARFWYRHRNWYRKRGIRWKRGWLLHGPPGCGKTSLARAVAEDLDIPVYAFDLASLCNDELRQTWLHMVRDAPCMALIEDVDAVFNGRTGVTGRPECVTFDCLLNCIDGVERSDGVLLVITTNVPESLDAALGTSGDGLASRPGRIDRILEMKRIDAAGLKKICQRVLPDHPALWEPLSETGRLEGDTPAQFQDRCIRGALRELWTNSAT